MTKFTEKWLVRFCVSKCVVNDIVDFLIGAIVLKNVTCLDEKILGSVSYGELFIFRTTV